MTARLRLAPLLRHAVLLALIVLTLYPVYLMLITSLKDNVQFYQDFQGVDLPLHLSNYGAAWAEVGPYLWNSIVISGLSVAGVVAVSALAAYAFAHLRFGGKEILYYMVIALL